MKSSASFSSFLACLLLLTVSLSLVMAFQTANTLIMRRGSRRGSTSLFLKKQADDSAPASSEFEREFQQKQKALSHQVKDDDVSSSLSSSSSSESLPTRTDHAQHQATVFNELASFFDSDEAIPAEVVPVLEAMVHSMMTHMIEQRATGEAQKKASRSPARGVHATNNTTTTTTDAAEVYRILDVGCGTGALFGFYLQAAQAKNVTIHIHGLDLATNMLEKANAHAKELLSRVEFSDQEHSIIAERGDICAYTNEQPPPFDLAVANACFGNFWDGTQALQSMAESLRVDGVLCITHPLGSQFVRQLHEDDPHMVPHLLPTTRSEFQQLARTLPLQLVNIVDKDDDTTTDDTTVQQQQQYYQATAYKVVYHTLPEMMRFRGPVDRGYGRGGKKLGFPTANLPSGLFQGALQNVPCGVYFGWAVLEGRTTGRNVPHKAVVNVGYSPTFEGQENPDKIVEAHLLFPHQEEKEDSSPPLDPPDFYGEVMRLQLLGFLRPEIKFPSFPALIAQISTDVEDATEALELECYQHYLQDPFLVSSTPAVDTAAAAAWLGGGGGDEYASWEFEPVESVVGAL